MTRLQSKRVLLLGAGALGRPIAEHCVRAGVAGITIMDNARVSPGLLVRQGYDDAHIGVHKAVALAMTLERIREGVDVRASTSDILESSELTTDALEGYDIVIDATADRTVAAKLERLRRLREGRKPALLSLAIDHTASAGIAAVLPASSTGGGVDLLRRFFLASREDSRLDDIVCRFFPEPGARNPFVPEPGCSADTFIGSHPDVTGLAAQLLTAALDDLETSVMAVSAAGEASAGLTPGSWTRGVFD